MRVIRLQSGVTLMELMVVMVIVGILAAIAYPSYRAQVIRTHRSEARTALLQTAQQLERCFTRNSTYAGCATLPYTTDNGLYQIAFEDEEVVADEGNVYKLVATPQGGQLADTQCGNLTLDQANRRDASGPADGAGCW